METTIHFSDFDYKQHYPDAIKIGSFEGGVIYGTVSNRKYYLIVDETILMDLLGEDIPDTIKQSIKIIKFDNEVELNKFLGRHYGGNFSFRATGKKG